MSDSDTKVEDLTPAQKETSSRHKNQMMKQRQCTNLINTRNEFGGTATIRKPGMAFKKKNKPGTGGRKKYKKRDLFTVKRYHGRKGLGKLMRPIFAGDHFQKRLALADKLLQSQTLPPLRETTWIPGDSANGINGHMDIDPRRHRSLLL
jgi:hypothetical protein